MAAKPKKPSAIVQKNDISNQQYLLTTKVYKNNVCVAMIQTFVFQKHKMKYLIIFLFCVIMVTKLWKFQRF